MTDLAADDPSVAEMVLVEAFLNQHPLEAAHVIDDTDPGGAVALLSSEEPGRWPGVLRLLRRQQLGAILEAAEPEVAAAWLRVLDPAHAAAALAWVSADAREARLSLLTPGLAQELTQIGTFPAGTAGKMMDARVALFSPHETASDALHRVRNLPNNRVSDLVLADAEGHFVGVVRLQDVATADVDTSLGSLVSAAPITVSPLARDDEVVALLNEHRLASLPVVDIHGSVVGIVRNAALVQAAQATAAGSLQQMVGGSAEEGALSPPWVGIKSRLPWLNINLVTAFMAASVVGMFEGTIARFTALAVLLPVVAGQSGNTGAQALAVTMRGLALREIRVSHAWAVVRKEAKVGLVNGLVIALVTAGGVWLWSRSVGLALVMFLAMIASMVAASISGALVPMVLVRFGRDPAVASSIVLTTVTDIAGFLSFLGLATLLSPLLASLAT